MALDTSIALQTRPIQLDNPLDAQTRALTLRQLGMQTQQAEQSQREQQTLADLYRSNVSADGSVNHQAVIQGLANSGFGNRIPIYQKQLADVQKAQADLGHVNAQTDELKDKGTKQRLDASGAAISSLLARPDVTHDDVIQTMAGLVQRGLFTPQEGQQAIQQLPGNPANLRPYLLQKGLEVMDASKRIDLLTPKFEKIDNGGAIQTGAIDQLTGQFTPGQAIRKVQTPDNIGTIASHLQGIRIQQANENLRSGIGADGAPTGDQEVTARAIASGQLPPPSGMALTNPRNQRVLARVMEINPNYDFTDITAKKAAATAFTSGMQGNALRSVATANAHLDQLGELVDALGNKDTQGFNRLANIYKTQSGNPAPTNFDAVKNVIGQEVVKAIVAGGGSAGERDEAAKAFSSAASPDQLNGAISHYRMVMQAQQENLLAQRRSAGLRDETLPSYSRSTTRPNTAPSQGAVVPIKSDADYNALPSGMRFQAPDGSIRVKP